MKIISIGRSETNNIVLNDNMISRRHAMLRVYATGKMEIIDLSQNGTFVNNVRVKPNMPVPVSRKDVVSFAHVMQLDWKMVPNPMKRLLYVGLGILGAAVIALALILLDRREPEQNQNPVSQPVTAVSEQPSEPETETEEQAVEDEDLKKMRDRLRVKKEKKAKPETKPESEPVEDTVSVKQQDAPKDIQEQRDTTTFYFF